MKNLINIKGLKAVALLLIGSLFMPSCKKFLIEKPVSSISADFVYNTEEGLQSAVTALYNVNRSLYMDGEWNYAMAVLLPAKTDILFTRAGEIYLYGTLAWGAKLTDYGTTRYDKWWKTYYKIVLRSNRIIQSAEKLNTLSDSSKAQILAEAKCWRAYANFTLFRLFHNIYLTTEPTTPENAFDIINDDSSPDEIYKLINSDLDYAIAHLDWTTPQFGRITQGVARTIKAKVALWQKNWAEAKTQSEKIINSGYYKLAGSTADVFKGDLNNTETIWAMQFADQVTGGGNSNRISWNFVPQYTKETGASFDISMGGNGAGFVLLNKYLRRLLAEDPNDDRADGNYYISYYTYNNAATLPAGKKLGDTIRLWSENDPDLSRRKMYYERLNPGCLKYVQEDANPALANQISNIMIYRLAETYLIAAEANMHLGNTGTALKQLNKVRNRAHAGSLTTIDQQTILDERARELAGEGQRWYTLKRMGVMYKQMTEHAGTENDNGELFVADARERFEKHMVNWPIPKAEINLLGPDYPQNDGYNN